MLKKVSFKLFGNEDYLCFNLQDLVNLEEITGKCVQEIFQILSDNKAGITMVLKIMPVALAECYRNTNQNASDLFNKIEKSFEQGATISSYTLPICTALVKSGIFGTPKNKAPEAEKQQNGPEN